MAEKFDRLKQISDGYMERTARLRKLSAPSIFEVDNAEEYRKQFQFNSQQMTELYNENARVLEETILPLLEEEYRLDDEEVLFLKGFADDLQNGDELEFLDVSLLWRVSDKLYHDAVSKEDIDYLVEQIDLYIVACMGKITQIICLPDTFEHWVEYLEKGIEAWERMIPLLEKERFAKIASEETKELLVVNSRYFCALYDVPGLDEDTRNMVLDGLICSLEMADDPFYTEAVPDYDWFRHRVKCLEYLGSLTERNNEIGLSKEQSKRVLPYVQRLGQLYEQYPEKVDKILSQLDRTIILQQSRYYAGELSREEFKDLLADFYRRREELGQDSYFIFSHFQLPNEYIGCLDRGNLTEEDLCNVEMVYRNVVNDAFQMPNKNALTVVAEYFIRMLDQYIEVPGGRSFRDFCVHLLAAIRPQDYVHALSVAGLARCLCGHLLYTRPELFIGVCGCRSADEAIRREPEICLFIYNAALVHDIGKIPLTPMMSVIERPVLPEDRQFMEMYPEIGSKMAVRAASTAPFVNVILQQGLRYDDRRICAEEKVIIDIVTLANDMDEFMQVMEAQGKEAGLDDFVERVTAGSGTIYAPYMEKLFSEPQVQTDIDYLFGSGRENIYRQTYVMLKEVQDRGHL